MRRLRKFLTMRPAERRVLLRSLVVLAWVRWTMVTCGLAAVEARTARAIGAAESVRRLKSEEALRVARLLHAAERVLPGRSSCLHLAAALRLLLAERGIASHLRFGVRNERGDFAAHAWLECDDRVLIGGTDVYERYAAFPVTRGGNGRS